MAMSVIPDIFSYRDYRVFLKDVYLHQKKLKTKYSYRQFARDLGFEYSNHLHLVIQGKRNLSAGGIEKIKKGFGWSSRHKSYFENLVCWNQAKNKNEKEACQAKLDQIRGRTRLLVSDDFSQYFGKWYLPVLREVVALKNFVSNLTWISRELYPKLELATIRDAMQTLERLKLIAKKENKWRQTAEHLATQAEVTSDIIHQYQKEMLHLSGMALDLPASVRDISSLTMGISKKQFEWLKKRLIEFRDEIQQQFQEMDDAPTQVAQLNIQFFPLTKG